MYTMRWRRFYWYNMSHDVLDRLKACKTFQQAKHGGGRGKVLLEQDSNNGLMTRIGITITGLLIGTQKGYKFVLLIQGYYSMWIELFPFSAIW